MEKECKTQGNTVYSQGIIAFEDESMALIHDSTYPPILHRLEYGPKYSHGINMDRGGFGVRSDGSEYACLFDGTGGGGLESLYAAQDFTDEMLHTLSKKPLVFPERCEKERGFVCKLLTQCSFAKPTTSYGDATCVFVDCMRSQEDGVYRLSGGALGDSGIIYIRQEGLQAHLFDTILKDDRTNMSDTGGCIGRYGMLYRPDNICIISQEIKAGDFVVLASDGLLDNLSRGEENEILSLIVSSSFFDLSLRDMKEKALRNIPEAEELKRIVQPFEVKQTGLTALHLAKRLNQYIKFVTAKKFEAMTCILEEWEIVESVTAKEALGRKFKEADSILPGKCDDCLIIAMKAGTNYTQLT